MDQSELKQILIKELGSLPFKDKKKINEGERIPDDLLERLIVRNKKRYKISRIMMITILCLILVSFVLNYFMEEEILAFTLFALILLGQLPQLIFHPDFKDYSKKELIFSLLKKLE